MNIPQTRRLHHVLKWLLSRGYKEWKTLKPSGQNVVAVTYDRLFMGGSNYILYLVLCSSKRLPTSNILSVFTQTVFKKIEKAIFFFLSGYP